MEDRIKTVMSAVLNVSADQIDTNTSPDNIETWDSLRHMNLIVALEEEFEIEFNDEDIVEMLNYVLIENICQAKVGDLYS